LLESILSISIDRNLRIKKWWMLLPFSAIKCNNFARDAVSTIQG
jgi:hypothetical protein